MIYRKFKLDQKNYEKLSQNEKEILSILEDVVKTAGEVYEQQLKDGFYPKEATKEQIEEAAKQKPSILSPFTVVEEKDGKLEAIPFYKKYAKLLKPIAEKIKKAAAVSQNRSFGLYLKARAKSLLDGSYKQADIVWFKVKNSKLDFSIGPFERYMDDIFFIKRIFQAHVGIVDEKLTKASEQFKETLYTSSKMSFDKHHSTDITKKGVNVFVEETPVTSGYMSSVLFSGEHFPSDLDLMKKYGSKILIYESQLKLKFEKLHYPIFKAVFEKKFAAKYSKELLLKATGWNILLYELGRQLHKYIGARERLKELYAPIDEANGAVSGIEHAKSLVVKGLIDQNELEAIMIIHIVWMFSDWLVYQENRSIENYVIADVINLNSYFASGALNEYQGISWPNFSKMFFEIENLANTMLHILQDGNYKEAEDFVKKNSTLENIDQLGKRLKKLKLKI